MYICWGILRNESVLAHLHIQYGRQNRWIMILLVYFLCLRSTFFIVWVSNFHMYLCLRSPEKYLNLAHWHIQYGCQNIIKKMPAKMAEIMVQTAYFPVCTQIWPQASQFYVCVQHPCVRKLDWFDWFTYSRWLLRYYWSGRKSFSDYWCSQQFTWAASFILIIVFFPNCWYTSCHLVGLTM